MSRRATAGVVRPSRRTRAEAQEVRRDAGRTLHPADAGRQQRVVVAVLDEPPAGAVAVARSRDRRGRRRGPEREDEVVVVAEPLPGVEEHLAHPGGAAAAAVVVPEARAAALGDARGADRVQAAAVPLRRRLARHRRDPGVLEGGEEQGGAGRAVAPAVGDLVHVGLRRDHVGHHEAAVARVTEGDEVLRAAARRVHQVRAVELDAGDGERGGDPGQPVRPVGHLLSPRSARRQCSAAGRRASRCRPRPAPPPPAGGRPCGRPARPRPARRAGAPRAAPSRSPAVPRVASLMRASGGTAAGAIHGCCQPSSVASSASRATALVRAGRAERGEDAEVLTRPSK